MQHAGKIALVTGSSRGIGRAIALRLAGEGADIVVNFFRNRAAAEDTAGAIRGLGRQAWVVRAHVGDEEKVGALFDAVAEQAGGLDILVCNAASGFLRPVLEQETRGWDWTLNINARALLLCAQRAAPLMAARGGGSIVSLSSLGSQRVLPDYVAVGVSKAAVETLTRYLAVELAAQNIVVNAVSGGIVETDALKHFPAGGEAMIAAGKARTPAGRLVEPDDIAGVVSFLCSPAAHMIRGQTIMVDGGYMLMM
ncbi:MAG: enoyl-[acyl-carrier-protein] reductase FabL [Chloroflexales bacterium]|nr:enoyl-[acyl-carrier-protein] reductase FabL [Chloroflexales bacterium]